MLILCFYFDGTEQIKSKQKAYDVNFSGIESTFLGKDTRFVTVVTVVTVVLGLFTYPNLSLYLYIYKYKNYF